MALLIPLPSWSQSTQNVLALHEGNATHPANATADEVFRETFGTPPQHQFFSEYLDEDRLGANDDTFTALLRKKYANTPMALIILDGWPALQFAMRHGDELWPGTPRVFYFLDRRELPATLPPNITGVAGMADYGAILDLALRLRPNTRRVFYVGGVNPWEQAWRRFAEQDFRRFAGRVEVTYLNDLALSDLVDRLSRLPDHSVVIYAELLRDADGHVFVPARVAPVIAAASNAPVYAPFDTYLGSGIVGGVILDFKELASQTARLGLRVLQHGAASGLPIERARSSIVLDWRQMTRWNIREASLPPGSVVRFREPGGWAQDPYVIAGALGLLGVQTGLIVALLLQRRKRRQAESSAGHLAGRLLTAQEAERTRIAGDLHDDVCQEVALVGVEVSHLLLRGGDVRAADMRLTLSAIHTRINTVAESLRVLSHGLHSGVLQHLGLLAALEAHCAEVERHYDVQVGVAADDAIEPRTPAVALTLFRIAQEALRNAATHGHARHATVLLAQDQGDLVLAVTDDGTGFDPAVARRNGGIGLVSMEERARLVKGRVTIASQLERGTRIEVRVPIQVVDGGKGTGLPLQDGSPHEATPP